MIKKYHTLWVVIDTVWFAFLAVLLWITAWRADINLLAVIKIETPAWFLAAENQPTLNVISFWSLVVLVATRIIKTVIFYIIRKESETVYEEHIAQRLDKAEAAAVSVQERLSQAERKIHLETAETVRYCDRTLSLIKREKEKTALAWQQHFDTYCRTTPKLYNVLKRTGRQFGKQLDLFNEPKER